MRSTRFYAMPDSIVQEPEKEGGTDSRANLVAGLMLFGILALALLGLATFVGLVGYGIRLILA